MKLFHGSDCTIKTPDVLHSSRCLDFGRGFYLTQVQQQAERWAKRKARLNGMPCGVVSVFELNKQDALRWMDFGEDLASWIDFVCSCRDGHEDYLKYDVIQGKVADDKVFRVVDFYKRGIWDRTRAIQEIRVYPTYDQIAFITQQAIDRQLTFLECYEVSL